MICTDCEGAEDKTKNIQLWQELYWITGKNMRGDFIIARSVILTIVSTTLCLFSLSAFSSLNIMNDHRYSLALPRGRANDKPIAGTDQWPHSLSS